MGYILTIGDPHFKLDNLSQVRLFNSKLENLLKTNSSISHIVILGDVMHYHEKVYTQCVSEVEKLFKICIEYCPGRVFVLVGNHDYIDNQQYLTEKHCLTAYKEWKGITIVDDVLFNEELNCVFVPYVPPGMLLNALKKYDIDIPSLFCIFAHQEFKGCKMGAIESEIGDEWNYDVPVISGHIHDKQIVGNVIYVGSCMEHAFGEARKTLSIFEINDERLGNREEIDLKLPRRLTYTVNEANLESIQQLTENTSNNNWYRINIRSDKASIDSLRKTKEFKKFAKQNPNLKFVFIPEVKTLKKRKDIGVSTSASFDEVMISLIGEDKQLRSEFVNILSNL